MIITAKPSKQAFLLFNVIFFFAWFLFSSPALPKSLKYNFSYILKGHNHGKILFIIPYRAYYESAATVTFDAHHHTDGSMMFYFNTVPEKGYMMRTSGFSGRTLVMLTAGYDLKKCLDFSIKKMFEINNIPPYYNQFIRNRKPFLFKIYPNSKQSLRFSRDPRGKHSHFFIDFDLRFQHHPEVLNIDFNIYKILLEMLKIYNHPFFPDNNLENLVKNPNKKWHSASLDYSSNLNRMVRMAARVMKKLGRFQQEGEFRLNYRIKSISKTIMLILGSSKPDIRVWGEFAIKSFSRNIQIRLKDNVLLADIITVQIRNKKGNGLTGKLSLTLIDNPHQ